MDILVAEFRGLFLGEGSVLITRKRLSGNGGWTYSPALTMDLAESEKETLEALVELIGGSLGGPYRNTRSENFRWRWRVDGFTRTPPLAKLLLSDARLPHPKLEQLQLLLDFCDYRRTLPRTHLGKEAKDQLQLYFEEMKALRC